MPICVWQCMSNCFIFFISFDQHLLLCLCYSNANVKCHHHLNDPSIICVCVCIFCFRFFSKHFLWFCSFCFFFLFSLYLAWFCSHFILCGTLCGRFLIYRFMVGQFYMAKTSKSVATWQLVCVYFVGVCGSSLLSDFVSWRKALIFSFSRFFPSNIQPNHPQKNLIWSFQFRFY